MPGQRKLTLLIAVLLVLSASVARAALEVPEDGPFRTKTLAEGVHLLFPSEDDGRHMNSLLVEQDSGLVVVDAQPTPAAARELLRAITRISAAPIRFVVISHPHADAAGGASAFPPSAVLVGSLGCYESLEDPEHDFAAEAGARAAARRGKDDGSEPVTTPSAGDRPTLHLVITGRTVLPDGRNPVDLVPAPPAHTRGDLMVDLPNASVLAVGDLVFGDMNPYGKDASLSGWVNVLNTIASRAPEKIVPLRGEVLDSRAVRVRRDSIAWLRGKIELAFTDLVPRDEIPEWVMRSEGYPKFFRPSKPYDLRDLVRRGVVEAVARRKKFGLD